jgi:hypothetical protein
MKQKSSNFEVFHQEEEEVISLLVNQALVVFAIFNKSSPEWILLQGVWISNDDLE